MFSCFRYSQLVTTRKRTSNNNLLLIFETNGDYSRVFRFASFVYFKSKFSDFLKTNYTSYITYITQEPSYKHSLSRTLFD